MSSLQKAYYKKQNSNKWFLLDAGFLMQAIVQVTDTAILQNEIDFLVYKLYGLIYDEVLIIDPQTPITKQEYERS